METMIDKGRLTNIRTRCGFDNRVCFNSVGNSGGIGLWWNNFDVNLVSFFDHHILTEIVSADASSSWFAGGVFGWID